MRRGYSTILGIAWAGCIGAGLIALERYSSTPAAAAAAPHAWPVGEPPLDHEKPTLLVFLHPKCPCSRATLSELAEVLASNSDGPNVRVLMTRPDGFEPGWERSSLWESAERLPHAVVEPDVAGAGAKAFGAIASGQILLYSPAGELLFNGGITAGRGQIGDNAGRRALVAALSSPIKKRSSISESSSKVFGCALFSADACKRPAAPDMKAVCP